MIGAAIDAVVLAAGGSRRMGFDKRLAEIGGQTLLARAVGAALASRVRRVLLVTEPGFAPEAAGLTRDARLVQVVAPDAAEGMAASLRAGIAALPGDAAGALVCLADMPLLSGAELDRVVAAFAPGAIAAAASGGRRGHPVLWSRWFFPALQRLRGDAGGRELLLRYADRVGLVELGRSAVLDADVPGDLARLRAIAPRPKAS